MPKACAAFYRHDRRLGGRSNGRRGGRGFAGANFAVDVLLLLVAFITPLAVFGSDESNTASAAAGLRLSEGDILTAANPNLRSISVAGTVQPWADGVVPYIIERTLPEHSIVAIEKAVAHWNEVSSISLEPVTASQISAGEAPDRLRFQTGKGCASWVGRRGGEQEVWVATNCTTGSILHEIGHALGLEHEHTRPDRDNYIIIHWENIKDDKTHNFDVAPTGSRLLGRYDYASIMHYGPKNFSKEGLETITRRFGSAGAIGQRVTPSAGDLAAIDVLYATDLSVIARVYDTDTAQEASVNVTNEHLQGANNIQVSISTGLGTLLPIGSEGWTCEDLTESELTCKLDRLTGGERSELLLRLSDDVDASHIEAQVSSKSPDNNLDNNSNVADIVTASSTSDTPSLGAAAGLLEDPVVVTGVGGGVSAAWLMLILFRLQRFTGAGVNRHARGRIKHFARG